MRKTQVALAAVALLASTAALADSVTVYGTVDASMVSSNNGGGTTYSGAGQWGANAIGFKGSSDLGGGLKAGFNLEGGFNSAYGTNANGGTTGLFNRAANVSLAGDFGTITAGVQVSPFIASSGSALALAGNNFVVPALANSGTIDAADAAGTAVRTGGFFISNAVSYANSAGPVSFSVLGATKGNNVAGNGFDTTNQYVGANISYSADNVYVTAAYADRETVYRSYMIGGTYTMGAVKVGGQYHQYTAGTNALTAYAGNRDTYILSASYALSDRTTVGVNYANTSRAASTSDPTLTNISLAHSLSKATSIYAFAGRGTNGSGVSYVAQSGGTSTTPTNAYGVGINHNF